MSDDNVVAAVVEDNPMNLYFNKTDETYFFLREAPYLETTEGQVSQLTFWSFNAYHRVFGLYVQRTMTDVKSNQTADGKDVNMILNVFQTEYQFSHYEDDWHHFAIYRPDRPYLSSKASEYKTLADMTAKLTDAINRQFRWYQSLTSMLMIGNFIGNPADKLTLDQMAAEVPVPINIPGTYREKPIVANKYFWQSAGRQLGIHLYIYNTGNINCCRLFVLKHPETGRWVMDMFPSSKIIAQYPTIRNELCPVYLKKEDRIVLDSQVFTMGLLYRQFGKHQQCDCYLKYDTITKRFSDAGKDYWMVDKEYRLMSETNTRYYNRFNTPVSVAGVYDLTQYLFTKFCLEDRKRKSDDQPTTSRYALYVCAGAKLTVRDSYHTDPEIEKHNQILVEQGGVVVVEDELEFSLPVYEMIEDSNVNKPMAYSWKKFCKDYIKNESMRQRVKDYRNPVVFLGANESDYNSIAWDLIIDKRGNEKNMGRNVKRCRRKCFLVIPEGAYIVAVEEWAEGIDEIWQRHQYEQLHRAIVRHCNEKVHIYEKPKRFQAPEDNKMLEKILTNTWIENKTQVDRHIEIDIHDSHRVREAYEDYYKKWNIDPSDRYNRKNPKVYPKEFNFYRFTEVKDKSEWRSYCPPPAYPPVKITNPETNEYRLYYLPQLLSFPDKKCDLRTVFKKYSYDPMTYKTLSKKSIYPFGKQVSPILELRKESVVFDEYEWKPINNPCDYKHLMENRLDYRLGVDGRYYEKTDHRIGKVQSLYYEFVDPSDDNKTAIQVNIDPKADDITRGHQPLFEKKTDDEITNLIKSSQLKPTPYIRSSSRKTTTSSSSIAPTTQQSTSKTTSHSDTTLGHSSHTASSTSRQTSRHSKSDDKRRRSRESNDDDHRHRRQSRRSRDRKSRSRRSSDRQKRKDSSKDDERERKKKTTSTPPPLPSSPPPSMPPLPSGPPPPFPTLTSSPPPSMPPLPSGPPPPLPPLPSGPPPPLPPLPSGPPPPLSPLLSSPPPPLPSGPSPPLPPLPSGPPPPLPPLPSGPPPPLPPLPSGPPPPLPPLPSGPPPPLPPLPSGPPPPLPPLPSSPPPPLPSGPSPPLPPLPSGPPPPLPPLPSGPPPPLPPLPSGPPPPLPPLPSGPPPPLPPLPSSPPSPQKRKDSSKEDEKDGKHRRDH
ncbi:uncharacterized protein LOC128954089 [Oppia nitens]|uniref:uncharacterized protein LOC128954089 n=1 Tax=Oppia nitens TaxID=1686743 RepID=UPI0023DC000C|nr:uncharacterized protein LOC128954089 [Oppia nitens]